MVAVVRSLVGMALALMNVVDTKLQALYKLLFHFNSQLKQLYICNKMEWLSYRSGCGIHGCTCVKAFKIRAGLGYR